MKDYVCPNCEEEWEVNIENGLVPGFIKSGYWEHKSDLENCPACEADIKDINKPLVDWEWVYNIK